MNNIKDIVKGAVKSPIETYDSSQMSEEEVLQQIESSMAQMDANSLRRVVFTNSHKTFEDVISEDK